MSAELERIFPALAVDGYALSSPDTAAYNCIAWAVGESHRWWEVRAIMKRATTTSTEVAQLD